MKKKIFIIQSFLKHILYTSLVHQTPLKMRQIAPNCTIFSKFFWGGQNPPDPRGQVASPLRGSPRPFSTPCATHGNVSATPGKNPNGSPVIKRCSPYWFELSTLYIKCYLFPQAELPADSNPRQSLFLFSNMFILQSSAERQVAGNRLLHGATSC